MDAGHKLCFVDMPFGRKVDPDTGVEIDFDDIYQQAIRPAVEQAGLACIRADEERTGGVIHKAMFARLLLAEFVIADLTTANPNVFYELGVRHCARPRTTIPIFATLGSLPFDVNIVRALPYDLDGGALTPASATALREGIADRIAAALEDGATPDSPLFDFIDGFPGIELSHEMSDVFRDRIRYAERFRTALRDARGRGSNTDGLAALKQIEHTLGDLEVVEHGVLVDLLLSYRDVEGWREMAELYDRFPAALRQAAIARQQAALALNRLGERDRAQAMIEALLRDRGGDAETHGIEGRIYKDRFQEASKAGDPRAPAYLAEAIRAYRAGFEAEPLDYYPGINAIHLLVQQGRPESLDEAERLAPIVAFAVARRGGASSRDYWVVATVFELATVNRDWDAARDVLPRLLMLAEASWMPETTAKSLRMLRTARGARGEDVTDLDDLIRALAARAADMREGR